MTSSVVLVALLLWVPSGSEGQGVPAGATSSAWAAGAQLFGALSLVVPAPRVSSDQPHAVRSASVPVLAMSQEETSSLKRYLLIGGSAGLLAGFLAGWWADSNQGSVGSSDNFWNHDSDYYYRINASLVGGALGSAIGALVYVAR